MAKPRPQKTQSVAPNYLTSLGITPPDLSGIPSNWSPGTAAAVKQYFAPGGQFQQTLNTQMVPTGQGGYTAAPGYQNVAPPPITAPPGMFRGVPPAVGQPIQQAPGFKRMWNGTQWVDTFNGQPVGPGAGQQQQPPPPPQATMDWGGLSGSLQSILAPYLSGGANAGAAGAGGGVMPALMKSLGGYLSQLQPTMEGQRAAAGQTPAPTGPTAGGTMNWGQLGGLLGGLGGAGTTGGGTQGQLLQQLLGYLGTMPKTATGGAYTSPTTGNTLPGNIGFNPYPVGSGPYPGYGGGGGVSQTPYGPVGYMPETAMGVMNQNVPRYMIG